jgi:hypothetical protein
LWVGVAVYHRKHDFKQSFAPPYEAFKKVKVGEADFPLGDAARAEYAKDGIAFVGWKPQVVEMVKVAATTTKPARVAKAAPVVIDMRTPGWTADEEAQIAKYIAEGLSRKSAVQKMRRAAKQAGRFASAALKASKA